MFRMFESTTLLKPVLQSTEESEKMLWLYYFLPSNVKKNVLTLIWSVTITDSDLIIGMQKEVLLIAQSSFLF